MELRHGPGESIRRGRAASARLERRGRSGSAGFATGRTNRQQRQREPGGSAAVIAAVAWKQRVRAVPACSPRRRTWCRRCRGFIRPSNAR